MAETLGIKNQTINGFIIIVITTLAIIASPAGESTMYELNVTYSNGSIISGPLSFGLSEVPDSVNATFILGPGVEGTEPEDLG